jgi:hypothetical protein
MKETYWEVSFGTYPGILLGFRTYEDMSKVEWEGDEALMVERNHVIYLPFLDLCIKLITLQK